MFLLLLMAQQPCEQGRPGQAVTRTDQGNHALDAPVQQIYHSVAPGCRSNILGACQYEIDFTQSSVELDGNSSDQVDLGQLSIEVTGRALRLDTIKLFPGGKHDDAYQYPDHDSPRSPADAVLRNQENGRTLCDAG
jgi:hypothetical protein